METLELNTNGDLQVATSNIGLIIRVGLHESPGLRNSSCRQNKVLVDNGGQPRRLVPAITEEHNVEIQEAEQRCAADTSRTAGAFSTFHYLFRSGRSRTGVDQ
jgi:hypothetical protein